MRRVLVAAALLLAASFAAGCAAQEEKKAKDLVIELPEPEEPEKNDAQTGGEEEKSSQDAEEAETQNQEKKGILISIDPGHQSPSVDMSDQEPNAPGSDVMKTKATGGTSGRYSGLAEYELNLDISLQLRDKLQEKGYDVIMTREDNDTAISNAERARMANEAGADIAIRIHANGSESSDANGALVLIGSAENPYVGSLYDQSFSLGQSVLDSYCESTGMQNLGVQTNDTMTGINWSEIPVIILEMGFMTNQQDDLNMADPDYQVKMVDGIADGINAYCESSLNN